MKVTQSHWKRTAVASLVALSFNATAETEEAKQSDSGIERIQITSQKRAQSIQEVGMAVTALDGSMLQEQGIENPTDIDKVMPNVAVRNVGGGGVPVVIIRGVGLQNFRINDSPTASFFIDEVYQTSIASAEFSMYDIERLEVLKGPQGGLYGRNTIGGAVQIISTKPILDDESSGFFDLGIGSYESRELEFAINASASENSAIRLSGSAQTNGDKDYYSVPNDTRHGESDRWGLRAQYLIQPSDSVELLVKVHGGREETELPLQQAMGIYANYGTGASMGLGGISMGLLAGLNGAGPGGLCSSILEGKGSDPSTCSTLIGLTPEQLGITGSPYASAAGGELPSLENKWSGISLIADVELDDMTLTSISAYDKIDYLRNMDADATTVEFQDINYSTEISFWSQEFRLISDEKEDFNWIVGVSISHDELTESTLLTGSEGVLPIAFSGGVASKQDYQQQTDAYSIYGHSEYKLSDNTNLTTELRYTDEEKSFDGGATIIFPGDVVAPFLAADDSIDFTAFSGKVGVTHQLNEQVMLFGNLSRGFKTGGFFGGFATDIKQLEPFNEETINAYEVGFKSDLANNTLRINGSAFFYNRSDVQLNAANPQGIVQISRLTNIGDVQTSGAELDITWAATEDLKVQAAFGYTDAFISDSDYTTKKLLPLAGSTELEGANLPNYSKFSANLQLRHEHELTASLFGSAQLEYSYRSARDLSLITDHQLEDPIFKEAGVVLTNLRYMVENAEGDWKVTAFINNVSDEIYREEARPDGLYGMRQRFSLGRVWGASFTYNW